MRSQKISSVATCVVMIALASEMVPHSLSKPLRPDAWAQSENTLSVGKSEGRSISIQGSPLTLEGRLEFENPASEGLASDNHEKFIFEGQAGQSIAIKLNSSDSPINIKLYNEAGILVAQYNALGGSPENYYIPMTDGTRVRRDYLSILLLPNDDRYELVVESTDSTFDVLNYSLSFQEIDGTSALSQVTREARDYGFRGFHSQSTEPLSASMADRIEKNFEAIAQIFELNRDFEEKANTLYILIEFYLTIGRSENIINTAEELRNTSERFSNEELIKYYDELINGMYLTFGDINQAEDAFEQIARGQTIDQYMRVANNINSEVSPLITRYFRAGQYHKALDISQQLLNTALADGEGSSIATDNNIVVSLSQLAYVHQFLGQHNEALKYSLQALEVIGNQPSLSSLHESSILSLLAYTYYSLNDYHKAIELAERSFDIEFDPGIYSYRNELALVILGYAYNALGEYDQSIEIYQKALSIATSNTSNNFGQNLPYVYGALGISYYNSQEYKQSGEAYHQALERELTLESPWIEGLLLSRIGELLATTGKTELAIVFYKKSVNVREGIRNNLRELDAESQISFIHTIADDYRTLANLLLVEDRVLEAQQVLDLLKVQELEDYIRGVRGNEITEAGLDYWPAEQQILDIYDRSLDTNQTFEAFLTNPDLVTLSEQLRRNARGQNLNPETLDSLQDNLKQLDNAALLYPLILDDRLELILVTPDGLSRKTVAIDRIELNRTITQFRSEILDPYSNPESSAQQLYEWLIRPIETELQQTQTETLLYAADGQLRYIPLSALHDGEQWLAQKFTVNHITAASLTDFSETGQTNLNVLAGAFTEGNYSYQVGDRNFNFSGLPFAGVEVENITKEISTTTAYFNQQFSPDAVLPKMNDNSIIHFATHATFVTGAPDDSFIVFGNGDRVTLREIGQWELSNVDLVVLSACETAVSGALGNGEEILGFGYQIQRTGARAAIASLWQVSDNGTQVLMNAFYTALKNGYSEADALRRAQIALVTNDFTVVEGDRASLTIEFKDDLLAQTNGQLSHPYYWASFILIGNGL